MNKLQRIIAVLWAVALIAVAVYPPWTIETTFSPANELQKEMEGDTRLFETYTMFRYFYAPPKWKQPFFKNDPNSSQYLRSGQIRFDLLALEAFIISVAAAGLLLGTRKGAGR